MHHPPAILSPSKSLLRARLTNKAGAITTVGRLLVDATHVMAEYIPAMFARGDDHLDILTSIAEICNDDELLTRLFTADSLDEVIAILQGGLSA